MRRVRIVSTLILLLSIIFLPYWIYLPLLGAAIIFFPFFWEGIFLGLLIDVLYGGGIGSVRSLLSPMAFAATILLIVMLPVRERIRVNA
jgi:hypothetical protein